ncbi:hypothetical protein [Sinorhizobium fredii]|uniref:hypothetical protein n=1 Tax=Rhizobium fredii TaxID=380 RepID=UPI0004BA82E6|nr:hypothetical protein [Sinorhizobium fredii]
MNAEKMRKLVEDCRRDLSDYLSPDSGISDREMVIALLNRLDGPQAIDALGEDFDQRPLPDEPHRAIAPDLFGARPALV